MVGEVKSMAALAFKKKDNARNSKRRFLWLKTRKEYTDDYTYVALLNWI